MLVESKLPRELWHYAIQTAAHIRNRCFSRRTGQTPYQLLTEKKPNVSKLHKFGFVCYTYKQDKKKLDSKCDQGLFVGYDKYSPACLVYNPDTNSVLKHRLVKFVSKAAVEKQTQTNETDPNEDYDNFRQPMASETAQEVNRKIESP